MANITPPVDTSSSSVSTPSTPSQRRTAASTALPLEGFEVTPVEHDSFRTFFPSFDKEGDSIVHAIAFLSNCSKACFENDPTFHKYCSEDLNDNKHWIVLPSNNEDHNLNSEYKSFNDSDRSVSNMFALNVNADGPRFWQEKGKKVNKLSYVEKKLSDAGIAIPSNNIRFGRGKLFVVINISPYEVTGSFDADLLQQGLPGWLTASIDAYTRLDVSDNNDAATYITPSPISSNRNDPGRRLLEDDIYNRRAPADNSEERSNGVNLTEHIDGEVESSKTDNVFSAILSCLTEWYPAKGEETARSVNKSARDGSLGLKWSSDPAGRPKANGKKATPNEGGGFSKQARRESAKLAPIIHAQSGGNTLYANDILRHLSTRVGASFAAVSVPTSPDDPSSNEGSFEKEVVERLGHFLEDLKSAGTRPKDEQEVVDALITALCYADDEDKEPSREYLSKIIKQLPVTAQSIGKGAAKAVEVRADVKKRDQELAADKVASPASPTRSKQTKKGRAKRRTVYKHSKRKTRKDEKKTAARILGMQFSHQYSRFDSNSRYVFVYDPETGERTPHKLRIWEAEYTVDKLYGKFLLWEGYRRWRERNPGQMITKAMFGQSLCRCCKKPTVQSCVDIFISSVEESQKALTHSLRHDPELQKQLMDCDCDYHSQQRGLASSAQLFAPDEVVDDCDDDYNLQRDYWKFPVAEFSYPEDTILQTCCKAEPVEELVCGIGTSRWVPKMIPFRCINENCNSCGIKNGLVSARCPVMRRYDKTIRCYRWEMSEIEKTTKKQMALVEKNVPFNQVFEWYIEDVETAREHYVKYRWQDWNMKRAREMGTTDFMVPEGGGPLVPNPAPSRVFCTDFAAVGDLVPPAKDNAHVNTHYINNPTLCYHRHRIVAIFEGEIPTLELDSDEGWMLVDCTIVNDCDVYQCIGPTNQRGVKQGHNYHNCVLDEIIERDNKDREEKKLPLVVLDIIQTDRCGPQYLCKENTLLICSNGRKYLLIHDPSLATTQRDQQLIENADGSNDDGAEATIESDGAATESNQVATESNAEAEADASDEDDSTEPRITLYESTPSSLLVSIPVSIDTPDSYALEYREADGSEDDWIPISNDLRTTYARKKNLSGSAGFFFRAAAIINGQRSEWVTHDDPFYLTEDVQRQDFWSGPAKRSKRKHQAAIKYRFKGPHDREGKDTKTRITREILEGNLLTTAEKAFKTLRDEYEISGPNPELQEQIERGDPKLRERSPNSATKRTYFIAAYGQEKFDELSAKHEDRVVFMDFNAVPGTEYDPLKGFHQLGTIIGPWGPTPAEGTDAQPKYKVQYWKGLCCGCDPCNEGRERECQLRAKDDEFASIISPENRVISKYWIGSPGTATTSASTTDANAVPPANSSRNDDATNNDGGEDHIDPDDSGPLTQAIVNQMSFRDMQKKIKKLRLDMSQYPDRKTDSLRRCLLHYVASSNNGTMHQITDEETVENGILGTDDYLSDEEESYCSWDSNRESEDEEEDDDEGSDYDFEFELRDRRELDGFTSVYRS